MRWTLPVCILFVTLGGCGGDDSPDGVIRDSNTFDMVILAVCGGGGGNCSMVCGGNDCDTGGPVLTGSDTASIAAILLMDRPCTSYPNLTVSWSNPATQSSGDAGVDLGTNPITGRCGGDVTAGMIPLAAGVQQLTLEALQGSETDTRSVRVDYRP